jgi:elongation factor 1-beta
VIAAWAAKHVPPQPVAKPAKTETADDIDLFGDDEPAAPV